MIKLEYTANVYDKMCFACLKTWIPEVSSHPTPPPPPHPPRKRLGKMQLEYAACYDTAQE